MYLPVPCVWRAGGFTLAAYQVKIWCLVETETISHTERWDKGQKEKAAVEIKCRAQEELIWVVYNKAGHEKIKNIRKWFWVNSVSFPETHTDIHVYTAITLFKTDGAWRTQGFSLSLSQLVLLMASSKFIPRTQRRAWYKVPSFAHASGKMQHLQGRHSDFVCLFSLRT